MPLQSFRVQGSVRLNDVIDDPYVVSVPCRQRPTQCADDTGGDRPSESERIADRYDELPHSELGGLAQLRWRRSGAVGTDHRQVRQRVAANDPERNGGAIGESNPTRLRPPNHMRIREQEAVVGDHDSRASARGDAPVAAALGNLQGSDRGVSCSAIETTTWEYTSRAAISPVGMSGRGCRSSTPPPYYVITNLHPLIYGSRRPNDPGDPAYPLSAPGGRRFSLVPRASYPRRLDATRPHRAHPTAPATAPCGGSTGCGPATRRLMSRSATIVQDPARRRRRTPQKSGSLARSTGATASENSVPQPPLEPSVASQVWLPPLTDSVNAYVEHAATLLGVEEDVRILVAEPYRQVDVQVPIHADDGSVLSFRGFRVQHNGARGRSRAACAITPTPTLTRSADWPL